MNSRSRSHLAATTTAPAQRRGALARRTALATIALALAGWWWRSHAADSPMPIAPAAATTELTVAASDAASASPPTQDRLAVPGDRAPEDPAVAVSATAAPVPSLVWPLRFEIRGDIENHRGERIRGARLKLWASGMEPLTAIAPDGRYRFEIEWRAEFSTIHIEAWADGYAVDEEQIGGIDPFAVVTAGIDRDIVLGKGWTIVGRALGESGPVAGAVATCWQLDGKRIGYFDFSDSSGRFAIAVRPQDRVERVVVRNGVFGQGDAVVTRARGDGSVDVGDVVLTSCRSVRGRIVSPSGRGLANLPVFVAVRDVSMFDDVKGMAFASLSSDAGGAFVANGLAPGSCLVTIRNAMIAQLEEMAGEWGAGERTIVVEGARVTVAFEWQGQPIAADLLEVTWTPPEGEWTGPAVSAAADRLVPFDTAWIVRAAFPGGQARGEARVDVGRQEQVHRVVHLH